MFTVFVVSDGSGATAEQVVSAALTQFPHADVSQIVRPQIRTEGQVHDVVREAAAMDSLIVHTLVTDDLRGFLIRQARLANVETIDLMGSLMARLSHHLPYSPSEKPGLFRTLNKAYFRRLESMEFAFRHDDGQRVGDLDRAELVLVGVSRTFKTPLSVYLAFKGWFVANVPIVLNIPPPPILFDLPPERVFGLTMQPYHLSTLRQARHTRLGGHTGDYADPDHVRSEIIYATNIFGRQPGWRVIDVTYKPIEEIASEILAYAGRRDATS